MTAAAARGRTRFDGGRPVDAVLARLDRVREVGPGKWISRCPAHDDRGPSLSIREMPDGRVLLHCFAECGNVEVLAAIGLSLSDLYPRAISHHLPKARVTFPAMPILRALSFEARIVFECGATIAAGGSLSDEDQARLIVALERIDAGLKVAEGNA